MYLIVLLNNQMIDNYVKVEKLKYVIVPYGTKFQGADAKKLMSMYNSFTAGIKVYIENSLGLKFYFGHYDQSEIQNGVKVTLPKLM